MSVQKLQTRWKLLILCAVFTQFAVSVGPMYNYNVFFVDLQNEFKTTAVLTGWVGSLGATLFCMAAPLAAVVGSKVGSLRVVLLGTVLASTGFLSTSFIPSLEYGFLTFGTIAGLGTSFVCCAAGSLLLDWFSVQEGNCRAIAGASVGASVGTMTFGPLLNTLIVAYGWRNCFRILSGIALVLGLGAALPFAKSPETQSSRNKTERSQTQQGKPPNEDPKTEGHNQDDQDVDSSSSGLKCLIKVLLNIEVWLYISSTTFAQLGWSFVIVNYSSLMEGIGLSSDNISMALLVFGAAEVGIKIVFAMFGDRLPCLKVYVISASSIGAAIISGFLTLCSTFQHMIILSVAWGICRGIIFGAYLAAADELFRIYGSRVVASISLLGFGFGALLGSPITGGLYDSTGDYTLSLFVLVASFALSALTMLLIPAKRKIQTQWRCCRRTTDNDQAATDAVCTEEKPKVLNLGISNSAFRIEA